jgi:formylglycine-generating enzyme required for sulfatase activity/CHAT domain-containing protein/tetratricopeptide (TPR) repeat protein
MSWPNWIRTGWRMVVAVGVIAMLSATAHAEELDALNQQMLELLRSGQYAEATTTAERAAAQAKERFGDNHPEHAKAIGRQAHTLLVVKRLVEAEPLFKRALEIATATLPPDHPGIAEALDGLGGLYQWEGANAQAEPLLKKALAIREKTFTADDPGLLDVVTELSNVYLALGRADEDERLLLRSISLVEGKLGLDHPYLAPLLSHLALRRMLSGGITVEDLTSKASGAEDLKMRSAAILGKAIKTGQFDRSTNLVNGPMMSALGDLAGRLSSENKVAEAGRVADLMRELRIKAVNANHAFQVPFGASAWAQLSVYERQNRLSEYETVAKQNIESLEKYIPYQADMEALLSTSCEQFAIFLEKRKNFSQAELYYKRAVALKEAGNNQLEAVETLAGGVLIGDTRMPEGLVSFYEKQGRFADGEEALARALAIREKHQGGEHTDVKDLRQRLTQWRKKHGASQVKSAPLEKPAPVATNVRKDSAPGCSDLLALLDNWETRKVEARKQCPGAVSTRLDLAAALLKNASAFNLYEYASLAQEPFEKRDWPNAVALLSRGVEVTANSARRTGYRFKNTGLTWFDSDLHQVSPPLMLIKAAYRLAAKETSRESELLQTAFIAAQHAHTPAAAVAVAQMVARQGNDDTLLARLVRERQDLVAELVTLDQQSVAAVRQSSQDRDLPADQQRRTRSDAIGLRLTEIDGVLAKDFPDYAALANPDPLSVAETQAQLRADEALVALVDTPQLGMGLTPDSDVPAETYVWVITKAGARWLKADLGGKALAQEVLALRCGLDETYWAVESEQHKQCAQLLRYEGSLPPFDLGRAHSLYSALFGKAGDLIAGKHLLVAPTGPFTSLPFQVLVTQKPNVSIPADPNGYRDVKWLGADHAITVLPSVASLKALRAHVKPSAAVKPFIGFGNPLLDGASDDPVRPTLARRKQVCPASAVAGVAGGTGPKHMAQAPVAATLFRGGATDVEALRQLTPLPETTDELCAVGRGLGATNDDIWLGARMTESSIKDLSAKGQLSRYRIIHLATHGLLAGDTEKFIQGEAEPSLIFTPPDHASEADDGLLTASEVTQLKLDADWVILSACNTAAGGAKEAEALSGLTRAFFYAGARTLLVSHWEVNSDAAVELATGAFDALKADPRIGRAEALRRSQRALIAKGGVNAHPATWAPFVLVGEGGVPQAQLEEPQQKEQQTASESLPLPPQAESRAKSSEDFWRHAWIEPKSGLPDETPRLEKPDQKAVVMAPPAKQLKKSPADPKGGESFCDCADCPEMVVVPAGHFIMGSPKSERDGFGNDEGPQHKVTIAKPFAVGKYAVTFAEWDACVADGGCRGDKSSDEGWGRGDRPVVNVNWEDSKAYVKWLSRKTGKRYRLPSEAEREYFARAGTTTPFWWGSSITPDQANYDSADEPYKGGGATGKSRHQTVPVQSFKPNPWGIYQVHGNVNEWTEDCWNFNHDNAPKDGSARTSGDCSSHVLRGGSFQGEPGRIRSAFRFGWWSGRSNGAGFRVVRTLSTP